MQVQVKHGLPRIGVAVEDRAIAAIRVAILFCDGGSAPHHFPHQSIVVR